MYRYAVEQHSTKKKISTYKFPKSPEERKRWSDSIPRADFIASDFTAVSRMDRPGDANFIPKYGKQRQRTKNQSGTLFGHEVNLKCWLQQF